MSDEKKNWGAGGGRGGGAGGLWSWSANKLHVHPLVMKLDFISQPSSKYTLPLAGLQQMQQCQVGWNIHLHLFLLHAFNSNEHLFKIIVNIIVYQDSNVVELEVTILAFQRPQTILEFGQDFVIENSDNDSPMRQ